MAIESAKDLYVANGADLRHWHDVSSDIIKYLKDKLNRAAEAVVYKGRLPNMEAFDALEPMKGDAWTNEETGVNYMWNGEAWVPVSLFRMDFDKEPIEDSINAIQSGYIWKALQNFIDDPTIYRIVGEADQDPELQENLYNISNQLADLIQDLSDLTERVDRIPDPLISPENLNEITKADDGGIFFDSEHCRLADRLVQLESTSAKDIQEIVRVETETTVIVGEDSPEVMYYETFEDMTFNFEALQKTKWMMKYLYVEALNDISLTFANASFADVSEDPHYGQAGYGILIRCLWIAGKVVLEVMDNSQAAANVEEWSISPEEPEPDPSNP